MVSSFDWIDFDALKDVDEIVKEVFSDAGIYNDKERLNAIIYLINQRISEIKSLSERKAFVVDDIKNDVTKNIAQTYYKYALTTEPGIYNSQAYNPHKIKRVTIFGTDKLEEFIQKTTKRLYDDK